MKLCIETQHLYNLVRPILGAFLSHLKTYVLLILGPNFQTTPIIPIIPKLGIINFVNFMVIASLQRLPKKILKIVELNF